MLNSIVKWSIAQRWVAVLIAVLLSIYGFTTLTQMPLDVFPDFSPPQVEIQTEAEGLAPEEVIVNWQVKNRLLAVPGVSNIVIFGGDERQYQVLINPESLKAFNVSLDEVKIRLLLQIKTHRGDF